jgi:GABA permease
MAANTELHKGLSQRQVTMLAIGGVIGAGLFVGSSVVISKGGPASFLSYLITGVLVVLVMRMLGEMAVANPATGSFVNYARRALGPWAGFSVGWLYWYFYVIVVGFEAVAGAEVLRFWLPDLPLWLLSLVLMIAMTATNLFSVSSYGEFEFWFAGIKVGAIILFLGLGLLFVVGLWPGRSLDFSNLYAIGGFTPNGIAAIFAAIVIVIFSMVGPEVATIAAAESTDPERAVTKATQSVIARIMLFYVGSIFLLAVIVPWNTNKQGASPFVAAFREMGIPYADHIMNAVVLTAVLSCLNSGLYTSSRMLFVLGARREAPLALIKVNHKGVPVNAILASSVIGFLCVIAAAISPNGVFSFLLNSSGAVILFVYLFIAVSQVVLRRRTPREKLKIRMWGFPWLSYLTIAAMAAVLFQMGFTADTRSQLALSLLSAAVVIVIYFVVRRFTQAGAEPEEAAGAGAEKPATRVLVMANQTLDGDALRADLHAIDREGKAKYWVCVPANPVDTGTAATKGAVYIEAATVEAAQERLDRTLAVLRGEGLDADGALGDFRPMRALDEAVKRFLPDRLVISTLPLSESTWHRFEVVDQARELYHLPVTHVVAPVREPVPSA